MKHPIIFLDVDGVIATPRQIHRYVEKYHTSCPPGYDQIDPDCMQVLKRIVNELDAHVVISSTWRKHERDLFDLMKAFTEYEIPCIGMTPISGNGFREREIKMYMDVHCLTFDDIIIIDDDTEDLKMFAKRQIVTNGETGLDPLTDVSLAHSIIEGAYKLVVFTEKQREELVKVLRVIDGTGVFRDNEAYMIATIDNNRVETVGENFDRSSYMLTDSVRNKLAWLLGIYSQINSPNKPCEADELIRCITRAKSIEK